jgi:hypothetical protein
MRNIRIPSAIALIVGVVMASWGWSYWKPITESSDADFILARGLLFGGVLIAMIACFALGRASKR